MPLPDPAPVLIVDDDDLVRGILRSRLERLGVDVVSAGSAEDALARMEMMRVAAIVLDVHMPGLSGLDLAEFIRLFGAHLTGVPILIFTGTSMSAESLDLARRYNADVYLKPEGLGPLLERLVVLADPVNQMLRLEKLLSGGAQGAASEPPTDHKEPES